ncbi:MAG: hypothetical protein E6G94_02005 [Alphaproteobacteria bacterium]|nr:MAG: hypothetical protein E6G94_02005 [Alphaproteobacteria bacterium]
MCDPLSLVLGGLSAAASLASNSVQANAVKKQENLNNQWMMMQERERRAEAARQEQMRQQAESARAATVQDMSPENQGTAQQAEAERLEEKLGGNEPAADPNAAVAAQTEGNAALLEGKAMGGQEFNADMGSRISKATADARARIRALATAQSFGGTSGGLQTRNALELNEGEQGINLANNMRQGSLSAFQSVQNIEPVKLNPVSNPWGGIASALGGMVGKFGKA